MWWWLPWWLPALLDLAGRVQPVPQVVSVAAGDFRRTQSAVEFWRHRPGALLALSVTDGLSQSLDIQVLRDARLSPAAWSRLHWIPTCGDSVTETADLTRWLADLPSPGTLTVVTSPEHLRRMQAIARVMAGSHGWQVRGLASLSSDHRPETPLRLLRDHLRAQLWRATGWTGRNSLICPARAKRLI